MTEAEMTQMADYYATETLTRAIDAVDQMEVEIIPIDTGWMLRWSVGVVDHEFFGEADEPLRSVLERWYLQD